MLLSQFSKATAKALLIMNQGSQFLKYPWKQHHQGSLILEIIFNQAQIPQNSMKLYLSLGLEGLGA